MQAEATSLPIADLLAIAAVTVSTAVVGISSFLDQSMRRPSLAGLMIHSVRLAF
jgi:hypothetical protein